MNCPKCGNEMRRGHLYGHAPIIWSEKKNKLTVYRGKRDVLLRGSFLDDSLSAHICKDCHKIIVDY